MTRTVYFKVETSASYIRSSEKEGILQTAKAATSRTVSDSATSDQEQAAQRERGSLQKPKGDRTLLD